MRLMRTPTSGAARASGRSGTTTSRRRGSVLAPAGSSASTAVPILPPICTSRPAWRRMWATSAVVVDLPLVPVMATKGDVPAPGRLARSRQNSSMSPITSTPAALRQPDRPVRFGMGQRHARRQHQRGEPRPVRGPQVAGADAVRRAAATPPGSSSCATTSAPPALRARAVARPEPPSPNRATRCPASTVTGSSAGRPVEGDPRGVRGAHGRSSCLVGAYRRAAARRASAGQANCSRSPAGRTKVRL